MANIATFVNTFSHLCIVTEQEALILLGATSSDYEDVVIDSIFEHKQFLLKSVITPQVFKTRARKIATINEAYKFLAGKNLQPEVEEVGFENLLINDLSVNSLLLFYREYENLMSQLKLKFMQNNDPYVVSYSCDQLAELENKKLFQLEEATSHLTVSSLIDVKISEFVNSGEVIKELKAINEELLSQDNLISFPSLAKDISRSRKYVNFTNLKNGNNA